MRTRDTYWKVSLNSTSTKRMLFSSGSVSRGPFLSHQAGYHYHSYSLGLVLKSTITIHEYTSQWNGIAATGDFNQYKSDLKSHDISFITFLFLDMQKSQVFVDQTSAHC